VVADRHQGALFAQLPPERQDDFLKDLEAGKVELTVRRYCIGNATLVCATRLLRSSHLRRTPS
jgi:hypothetical protein